MVRWLIIGLILFGGVAEAQPFKPGERLSYDVSWFIFPAGNASLEVQEFKVVDDTPCYHFVACARSQIMFFFSVNDVVESYCTSETLRPVRFEKHLSEGKYKKDSLIIFNRENNTAQYKDEVVPVGPDCRDVLGAFYYFRMMKMPEPGQEVTVWVHDSRKDYPLLVKVIRRERVKVPAGEFNTVLIKIIPHPDFEGLFRNKGNMLVWLSEDPSHVPVKAKVEVAILGSVTMVLVKN